jgi:hypothetical protein
VKSATMLQTADARRSAYDPDELEEEQRDRERQKRINSEFKRFTLRVQDSWDNDCPRLKLEWDKPVRCALCLHGTCAACPRVPATRLSIRHLSSFSRHPSSLH